MNITEAEFDALEYVAIEGRVGAYDGPHILSLLERLRPFAKRETDSPRPVAALPADEREAIVEGLFAIERQLEGPLRGDLGGYARDQRQAATTLRTLLARHY